MVNLVLNRVMSEDKAIQSLQKDDNELRRQKEMYQSNIECRKKIGWKQIN
jgi:hypothetical protein